MLPTVRTHAHLVKAGDIVLEVTDEIWCVLGTLDGWDGSVMLHVLDLCTGNVSNEFFNAYDTVDVLA